MAIKTKRVHAATIDGDKRNDNFKPFISLYSEEELQAECNRCLNCPKPSCKEGCPISNRIPEFIQKAKEGNYKEAFEIISDRSIMPDICGIICPHEDQCEGHCIRNKIDEPVAIGQIERFIGEWAIKNGLTKKNKVNHNGKKVACIGSGPASIACAEKLSEAGYAVTIYEKSSETGGVLSWGIPSYRLPRENVDDHIKRLIDLGVNFICDKSLGKDIHFEELQKEYDAIFLGIGAYKTNKMNVEGENLNGIYHSDEFLTKINLSPIDENGQRHFDECGESVLICGGGNVAMDAARDAIRLPQVKKVTIMYRRTESEMPAAYEELNQAKEEGIEFMSLHTPVAFLGSEGKLEKVEVAIMELGEPDDSGRRRPIETAKEHLLLKYDTVVLALGYGVDGDSLKNIEGLEVDARNRIIVDEEGRTSLAHVYAGGDDVTGAKTVVSAMKAGLIAAETIKKDLA